MVLNLCTHYQQMDDHTAALDGACRKQIMAANDAMTQDALRVLGLAYRLTRDVPDVESHAEIESSLVFVGLIGMIDPPRPEVPPALELGRKAGIRTVMITGDYPKTARAIAESIGLLQSGHLVLTGSDLNQMDDAELQRSVEQTDVFARVSPEHKMRIVEALRARGEVVAMTGDGVNDAPSIKRADIGVAMGITGTEVAKEAATMVLTDDNFATIVQAVREGRAIYENIVKFVRFQLSTNMGAIQTVLGASLLGWPTPFTAIQILWINIIMDGPPAMSLGVEPARDGVMDEPPRRLETRILSGRRFIRLFVYGLTMAVGTLALFDYAQPKGEAYALTLAFTTFVLFQFFNMFNARAEDGSAVNRLFFSNRWLWLSLGAVLALQVLVVHWGPAQSVFRTTDLALTDWGLAALVASSVLVFDEGRKLVTRLFSRP
jgi:Ca2+-transporting ATPase